MPNVATLGMRVLSAGQFLFNTRSGGSYTFPAIPPGGGGSGFPKGPKSGYDPVRRMDHQLARWKTRSFKGQANGTLISSWPDISGNGRTATGGTNIFLTDGALGNNLVVKSTAGALALFALDGYAFNAGGEYTVAFVFNYIGGNPGVDTQFWGTSDGSANGMRCGLATTGQWQWVLPNINGWYTAGTAIVSPGWNYCVITMDGSINHATAPLINIYINGALLVWDPATPTANGPTQIFTNSTSNGMWFLGGSTAGVRLNVEMAEFIIFDRALSNGNRTNIENYFAFLYGQ